MPRHALPLLALLMVSATAYAVPATPSVTARPKLILTLVIDQFRADYLTRFEGEFLAPRTKSGEIGGFRHLMSQGAYFPMGEYEILHSMTGPGHATILTGAYPYLMGIPVNDWYDPGTRDRVYCTEDSAQEIVGFKTTKKHLGTSPKNLIGSTVGDELKNAGYPSRVVSLALKDRAAILMGGSRADLAMWFDKDAGHWVSSTFYRPDRKLPDWVTTLNQNLHAKQPCDLETECGLEMTEVAAEAALQEYKLGQGKATDLLAVSFSSHDYAGHHYGPNSPQLETMTLAEDRLISKLLNVVKKRVPGGLANVVVVLTGDHGIPPIPELVKKAGVDAGRLTPEKDSAAIESYLETKYGKPAQGKWMPYVADNNFYLNEDAVREKKLDLAAVEEEVKPLLIKNPGVFFVFSRADYLARKLPPGMLEKQILKTYFPKRGGNLVVIPKPFYMEGGGGSYEVTHMTGFSYDRTVPIILSGFGFQAGVYPQTAHVVDIAPTLSFLAGTIPPALSEGRVLSEAMSRNPDRPRRK